MLSVTQTQLQGKGMAKQASPPGPKLFGSEGLRGTPPSAVVRLKEKSILASCLLTEQQMLHHNQRNLESQWLMNKYLGRLIAEKKEVAVLSDIQH